MWAELVTAAAIIVAALFAAAGALKLRDLRRFTEEVADYRLVGARGSRAVAVVVPPAELAAALLLIVPATREAGAALALVLLAVFTAAVGVSLRRGNTQISCACFGAESRQLSVAIPVRNAAMALPLAGGLAGGFAAAPELGAVVSALVGALFVWAVVTALEMRDSEHRLAARTREVADR